MTKEQFQYYLKHPGQLNEQTLEGLKEIINDYPWFSAVRMLYLRNLLNIGSYRFERELEAHSIFISDRVMLFKLLNENTPEEQEFQLLPYDKEAFSRFFDNDKKTISTSDELINSNSYAIKHDDTLPENTDTTTKPDLIDKFISENPAIINRNTNSESLVKNIPERKHSFDDGLITETLAGIYVKQGLYSDALKAYEKLSLKFPEKNSYFAAQIDKIKNLISKD